MNNNKQQERLNNLLMYKQMLEFELARLRNQYQHLKSQFVSIFGSECQIIEYSIQEIQHQLKNMLDKQHRRAQVEEQENRNKTIKEMYYTGR